MKGLRRGAPALLAVLLGAALLAGCGGWLARRQEQARLEELAAERALAYVSERLGREAEVLEVRTGWRAAGEGAVPGTDALVTVDAGEERFQVYVETAEPAFCRDNRDGLALARRVADYFAGLYRLPGTGELEVTLGCPRAGGFFGARPGGVARDRNFLSFDYRGQPLAEVLPLLESVTVRGDYIDDSLSLAGLELRGEDWAGAPEKLRVELRVFRPYNPAAEVPLGIAADEDGAPVLMAEGMVFSRRGSGSAGLAEIAGDLPAFALRERLLWRDGATARDSYTLAPMGDFWVSTREGVRAEDCFVLTDEGPDWRGAPAGIGSSLGAWYTREELLEEGVVAKSVRKALLPFAEARCRPLGLQLMPKAGAEERMAAWEAEGLSPVWVMIRPSLVYGAREQVGAGLLWGREGEERRQVVRLYTSYRDEEERWLHALGDLAFRFPGPVHGVALVEMS